jgi:prepilin-type N-terminal cleavage/methylation domain-containing protein
MRCRRASGFTIIELMTVMIIAAILLVIAIPSFNSYFAKRRVEGVFSEMHTDLQLARSEAVARNRAARVTFGTNCYVVHVVIAGSTTTCTQTTETISAGDTRIKLVQLQAGTNATLAPQSSLTFVEFDPVRGAATWNGSGTVAAIDATSTAGPWQLRATALATGRVQLCSPGGTVEGFATC